MRSAPRVAVVDYGIGNLRSAQKALQRVGADATLTSDRTSIAAADAVVLPGVGAFGACMTALRRNGLDEAVLTAVESGRPFLGICVGMQMLFEASEESPDVAGLGVIDGTVRWIPAGPPRPQMQWNQLCLRADDELLTDLGEAPWMYFVHSFHAVPDDPSLVVAEVDYGARLTAMIRKETVAAVQFHPEKSATCGLGLLANFVAKAGE